MGHLRLAGFLAILAFGCEGTHIEPRADEGRTPATPTPEPELIEPEEPEPVEPKPMELEEELDPVEPEPEEQLAPEPKPMELLDPVEPEPEEQLAPEPKPMELEELEPEELDSVEPELPIDEQSAAEDEPEAEARPAPGLDDGEECTEDAACDSGYCEELAATFDVGISRSRACCAVECSAGAVCAADGSRCRTAGTVEFEFLENGEICTEDAACDSGYCEELAATFDVGISRSRACCAVECSAGAVCAADGSRCISPPACEYDKSDLFVACL